ncbi:uncharacterized protein [Pseudochaenichthys georgianus]|uniref:uncharacterized protein n=1 Tax=Pseudochaenichthys georgianus TaxID=52239 RepID=UPI0039C4018A
MAIVDLVARWPGSTYDARILREGVLHREFEAGRVNGLLIGYPLKRWLMTPVIAERTAQERRYNDCCFAPGCSHRSLHETCSFYRFPANVFQRRVWIRDIMSTVPSREKNKTSLPSSFRHIQNCRMIVDCTDIKIAIPKQMDIQKETYSAYRGMHSFKLLLGVAPNAVITYCSKLYPGSTSDKEIVRDSGVLQHFKPGDLILADKGFLIQNILPEGVTVNIPPFLCHGQLTHSEAQATKLIAQNRIHVERANARLKEFRILKFIPSHLRHFADKLVQVCCALVNFQRHKRGGRKIVSFHM